MFKEPSFYVIFTDVFFEREGSNWSWETTESSIKSKSYFILGRMEVTM